MPTTSIGNSRATQLLLPSSTEARQDIDYAESGRSRLAAGLHLESKTIRIVSGPVSLRKFVFWGAVIFIAGFLHGKQISNIATRAAQSVTREGAPIAQTTATPLIPAPAQQSTPLVTRVPIRLMKFSPQTIEIKTGQTVEWTNDDLTPHTVTSQGAGDLNSGSIDAGASWRHTFSRAGSFQYYCTFHPEMNGTVVVR